MMAKAEETTKQAKKLLTFSTATGVYYLTSRAIEMFVGFLWRCLDAAENNNSCDR